MAVKMVTVEIRTSARRERLLESILFGTRSANRICGRFEELFGVRYVDAPSYFASYRFGVVVEILNVFFIPPGCIENFFGMFRNGM